MKKFNFSFRILYTEKTGAKVLACNETNKIYIFENEVLYKTTLNRKNNLVKGTSFRMAYVNMQII
jgi:hypothetical protein